MNLPLSSWLLLAFATLAPICLATVFLIRQSGRQNQDQQKTDD